MDGMARCDATIYVTTYAPYKSRRSTKVFSNMKARTTSWRPFSYNTGDRVQVSSSPDPYTPMQKLAAGGERAAKAVSKMVQKPFTAIERTVRRWNPFHQELSPAEAAALAASRSGGTIVSTAGILPAAARIRADLPPALPKPARSAIGRKMHFCRKRLGEAKRRTAMAFSQAKQRVGWRWRTLQLRFAAQQ
jgi:hypothetical protein